MGQSRCINVQNASLGVKAVFFVLTMLGHASLWAAIAADMGVSLIVIANALRLLRNGSHSNREEVQ